MAEAYCPHCRNDGLVTIDGAVAPDGRTAHDFAAPCPICDHGHRIEEGWFGAFWTQPRLASFTWNGGLTSQHRRRCRYAASGERYPCGQPTTGVYCRQHEDEANRTGEFTPPDVSSLPRPKIGSMELPPADVAVLGEEVERLSV